MSATNNNNRYQRQLQLREFGEECQQKLQNAKVLVAGVGGLGCPALQYLCAMGVGTIGIADNDMVELSNLPRQLLYDENDIGILKTTAASSKLKRINSSITIVEHAEWLTNQNALDIIENYDLVLDGTDNFETRYVLNDACVLLDKPLVYGSVFRYEGQVAVFNYSKDLKKSKTNYRDIFPVATSNKVVPNCEEAGVLGVLPGIIGIMQAAEAVKIITGIGTPLSNKLTTYNMLRNEMYTVDVNKNKASLNSGPKTRQEFLAYQYQAFCQGTMSGIHEIDIDTFNELLNAGHVLIVDVREAEEYPHVTSFEHRKWPLSMLQKSVPSFKGTELLLFCATGKRSLVAARLLARNGAEGTTIYSLKGGILEWERNQKIKTGYANKEI